MLAEHKIASLRLEVCAANQAEALRVRTHLRGSWERDLAPVFDHTLSTLADDSQCLHLEKLVINVHIDDIDQLAAHVSLALARELGNANFMLVANEPSLTAADSTGSQSPTHTYQSLAASKRKQRAQSITTMSINQWSTIEFIRFYLSNGHLPWFIDAAQFQEILAESLPQHFQTLLPEVFQTFDLVIWFRILDLLIANNVSDWEGQFLALFTEESHPVFPVFLRVLNAARGAELAVSVNRVDLILAALIHFSSASPGATHRVWRNAERIAGLFEYKALIDLVPDWTASERILIERYLPYELDELLSARTAHELEDLALNESLKLADVGSAADKDLAFSVEHAGLVLLAPFLKALLNKLGIEPREHQIASKDLPRAAAILHCLATGEHGCHEYQLGFIKILLGCDFDEPINVARELLNKADVTEIEGLIIAATSHWSALGSISIAGFRHTFLDRSGVLEIQEDRYSLVFERLGYDVLIDRLPWTLQWVNLPWMHKAINVSW